MDIGATSLRCVLAGAENQEQPAVCSRWTTRWRPLRARPSRSIAYDVTPPTKSDVSVPARRRRQWTIHHQFDLRWYTSYGGQDVGPDDPGNANHPTKLGADTDLLSPWMTYKIYFGTYNTLDVPEDDSPYSETTGFVYTNYIVNNAYRTWPSITASSKIEDQSTTLTNYSTLTNMTQTGGNVYSNRVYNLDFDQDYIVDRGWCG